MTSQNREMEQNLRTLEEQRKLHDQSYSLNGRRKGKLVAHRQETKRKEQKSLNEYVGAHPSLASVMLAYNL
jgi:hypothetical protein